MILVALGSNLPFDGLATPRAVVAAALNCLSSQAITPVLASPWYQTRPVPISDQPWYVNGVVAVETALAPKQLMSVLHAIEAGFGRLRSTKNAARSLDLDLLDYHGQVLADTQGPILPHPRMSDRSFVLLPLRDVAPDWRHPVSGLCVQEMIAALPDLEGIRRLDPE